MVLIAVFAITFAAVFLAFRSKGEKTADCVHKGLVAALLTTLAFFILATLFSYV